MTSLDTSPKSPCIDVCAINADKICVGCYRNLDEIAAWSRCSDQQKEKILRSVDQRRDAAED